ncbi:MAG TPA: glycosyltransferase family protein [Bacillota bacterium]|nr:glycosyltransferase family protein [Bacillota bacterium]HOL10939.1 glycosyltransferase family protein [Bacillota bacterium]HPO97830.1 glycosyltransferase family protein [Bacillota bacterium]
MSVVIIIQARMGSTRLPGKIMKQVLGKTLLEYQLERLSRVTLADQVVVATTSNDNDTPIVKLCTELGVAYYRGSEDDVLARYYEAATQYNAQVVVRITSDCPLIDPLVVDQVIGYYLEHQNNWDYVSNTFPQLTYPRGLDTEVFSYRALQEAYHEAVDASEREHVTIFIKRRPERYRIFNYTYQRDESMNRWTVDTPEDFELIRRIVTELYPKRPQFTLEDCLQLIESNPDWKLINAQIAQKLVK